MPNPLLGVFFHWLGGLASASFYVPYKNIKGWSWEIFWLIGGFFSWIVAPWLFAWLRVGGLLDILSGTPGDTLAWCWFWGAMWGLGGLTFGLTMRYLGMSLGMAVALGLTTVIGTMGPPLFHGTVGALAAAFSGQVTLFGVAVAMLGIVIVACAGRSKEAELTVEESQAAISEFDFRKGILVAIFSGVMSSCFAFGLDAGAPIRERALALGAAPLSQGLPVLCVVLLGGMTTNFLWCAYLIRRNKTAGEFMGRGRAAAPGSRPSPLIRNYFLAALGGTIWYFQFFFYTMGESQMGKFGFSSWTLHMASIIIFSTLWGFALKEWQGASRHTRTLVWGGIGTLVASTIIIGIGNYLAV